MTSMAASVTTPGRAASLPVAGAAGGRPICPDCGRPMWLRNGNPNQRCTQCRLGWNTSNNALGGVGGDTRQCLEKIGEHLNAPHRGSAVIALSVIKSPPCEKVGQFNSGPSAPIKVPSGRALMAQDKQNRIDRAARLAAHRAAQTARQRAVMGG